MESQQRYTFDDERIYIREEEDKSETFFVSSTTITGGVRYGSYHLDVYKAQRAEALGALGSRMEFLLQGEEGTRVHKATEQYDAGQDIAWVNADGKQEYTDSEWRRVARYIQFQEEHKPTVISNEERVFCEEYMEDHEVLSGFAGTLDRILHLPAYESRYLTFADGDYVFDIKSGKENQDNAHKEQVASYWKAKGGRGAGLAGTAILYLNMGTKKGWKLVIMDNDETEANLQRFVHKLNVWRDNNMDFQPRRDLLPTSFTSPHKENG